MPFDAVGHLLYGMRCAELTNISNAVLSLDLGKELYVAVEVTGVKSGPAAASGATAASSFIIAGAG